MLLGVAGQHLEGRVAWLAPAFSLFGHQYRRGSGGGAYPQGQGTCNGAPLTRTLGALRNNLPRLGDRGLVDRGTFLSESGLKICRPRAILPLSDGLSCLEFVTP